MKKMSKIDFSRSKVLEPKKTYTIVPSSLNSDEEQLLGVIYAPNSSGFPDCSLAAVLNATGSKELREYTDKLMYRGNDTGTPDSDAAIDTIIPRRVQYGNEIAPYLNIMQSYLDNLKHPKHEDKK